MSLKIMFFSMLVCAGSVRAQEVKTTANPLLQSFLGEWKGSGSFSMVSGLSSSSTPVEFSMDTLPTYFYDDDTHQKITEIYNLGISWQTTLWYPHPTPTSGFDATFAVDGNGNILQQCYKNGKSKIVSVGHLISQQLQFQSTIVNPCTVYSSSAVFTLDATGNMQATVTNAFFKQGNTASATGLIKK